MPIVWATFLARVRPVSTSAKPACMNITRKPATIVQTMFRAFCVSVRPFASSEMVGSAMVRGSPVEVRVSPVLRPHSRPTSECTTRATHARIAECMPIHCRMQFGGISCGIAGGVPVARPGVPEAPARRARDPSSPRLAPDRGGRASCLPTPLLALAPEGRHVDAEDPGGFLELRAARKHAQDVLALDLLRGEVAAERRGSRGVRRDALRERLRLDLRPRCEDQRPLD